MNLLELVGMGTVTSTKDTNTSEITVYIPNLNPAGEGRLNLDLKETSLETKDADGNVVKVKTLRSNSVSAKWRQMSDSNRITPPDVREGSQVAVYQLKGSHKYYWTTSGVNAQTFKLETVVYGWSANPNINEDTDFNEADYYIMAVDTRDGSVRLRTSDANAEKSRFELAVNGMEGRVDIAGSNGSIVSIDDFNSEFLYTNILKTFIHVDKKNITLSAEDILNILAKNTVNLKTKEFNIQADNMNVKVTNTVWEGDMLFKGNINQQGNYQQLGNYTLQGDYTLSGAYLHTSGSGTIAMDYVINGYSFTSHFHIDSRGGNTTPIIGS